MTSVPELPPVNPQATQPPPTPMKEPQKYSQKASVRGILRHPTGKSSLTLDRWQKAVDEWTGQPQKEPDTPQWDMIRKRPCTPNDQYSCMNEEQLQRIRENSRSNPIFRLEEEVSIPNKRFYMDRYATGTSQYLLRGQPGSNPWCWIDKQWWRYPPEQHDTSRFGASVPWGPEKMGMRTFSHFDGEDIHRYVNIDVYCRPPTNIMEQVVCKFGRAPSYYHQKKPHTRTWFGSSHELNRTDVLRGIQPKSRMDYDVKWGREKNLAYDRKGKWPEFSEYTDRFLLKTLTPVVLPSFDQNKAHVAEARALEKEQEQK
ncbi:hypothetical protein ACOMHN_026159 [Nucella lapillus]